MAVHQYRVSGEFGWMSNSGNALLAFLNPVGSNKKIIVKSLEISNLTSIGAAAPAAAVPERLRLSRATVTGGIPVRVLPVDTDAASWPSTVVVTTRAAVTSPVGDIGQIAISKELVQSTLAWGARQSVIGSWAGLLSRRRPGVANTEGVTIRAGESVALYVPVFTGSVPLRIRARLVRAGSPARTYETVFFTHLIGEGIAAFSVENQAGSGETVSLVSIAVEEVGTFDSPYFQLVPAASINTDSLSTELGAVSLFKMDTAAPDPSSFLRVYTDVQLLPIGMPENALSEASVGSPKGFNYLKTKDFLGPVYRTLFPEYVGLRQGAGAVDGIGHLGGSHLAADLGFRDSRDHGNSNITIREGEIIALVSAAETAAGATVAVGMSGWSSLYFAATLSVEPKSTPTLSLTGLKNPTEIRVFNAGTTTQVAGEENVTSGTFSWVYDPEAVPSVDIAILSLGYQNTRLLNVALGYTDITIPVQQQLDRQYLNP